MNQMPNSIPTSNNHRIALLFPEHTPSDFERLEDLAADARRPQCCAAHQCRRRAGTGHGAHVHEWQQCADTGRSETQV